MLNEAKPEPKPELARLLDAALVLELLVGRVERASDEMVAREIGPRDSELPVFDTTRIHAEAAMDFGLGT